MERESITKNEIINKNWMYTVSVNAGGIISYFRLAILLAHKDSLVANSSFSLDRTTDRHEPDEGVSVYFTPLNRPVKTQCPSCPAR
jgi:hypothetical protein